MKVVRSIAECRGARRELKKLGFVPTMGALHAGHVSLMEIARRRADHVAVSIFVNPTQFGPREDYTKYPRPLEEDLAKCQAAGANLVFVPEAAEIYPEGEPEVVVDLPQLTTVLEGKHRPGHFRGVCQVVAKLFNIVRPDVACFGQKDFQQLRVLTAMVQTLNWPIEMVPCPTLRDPDGLAMSSRNQYLSLEERNRGLAIPRALKAAEAEYQAGVRQTNRLIATMTNILLPQHLNIDYVAAVDPMTLKNLDVAKGPTLLAIAARVGTTRLIDNLLLQ
ncbi:MAG TPA: pantoate--beta-alanine ligase [Tepidisphaeraceae bacterium]|nr:pantoate--beta-alanine ligase [Tepidisphaeraceae bacterium]